MSYTAINVQSLAKRYKIGQSRAGSKTLVESVSQAFRYKIRKPVKRIHENDYFWALRNVSFEVKQGDVVGIIGHNGAGKSTLLKILSRITEPTGGSADIYGRVGSLLEVGTGFHRELTGRENIYLNGAILGMKKTEIQRRFDEMVAFAEVEKFIDTPVKHYSSGMHLRLAFSVAAHLEPEILLVDEVLAVGDLAFQKKCLNKIEDVATAGRTVLFVSHNMGAIKELCRTALVLKNGEVDYCGPVVTGIHHYCRSVLDFQTGEPAERPAEGFTQTVVNGCREEYCVLGNDDSFEVTSDLNMPLDSNRVVIHCLLEDAEGQQVVHNYIRTKEIGQSDLRSGSYRINARVPALWLKPGVYTLFLKLIAESDDAKQVKYLSERVLIDITDKTGMFSGQVHATILPPIKWDVSPVKPVNTAAAINSEKSNNAFELF